jgi:hypothetical protein
VEGKVGVHVRGNEAGTSASGLEHSSVRDWCNQWENLSRANASSELCLALLGKEVNANIILRRYSRIRYDAGSEAVEHVTQQRGKTHSFRPNEQSGHCRTTQWLLTMGRSIKFPTRVVKGLFHNQFSIVDFGKLTRMSFPLRSSYSSGSANGSG